MNNNGKNGLACVTNLRALPSQVVLKPPATRSRECTALGAQSSITLACNSSQGAERAACIAAKSKNVTCV